MHNVLSADCLPLLIGSIPLKDHQEATDLVLKYTPEIPLWAQLPLYKQEGMLSQFLPGMPGYETLNQETEHINTDSSHFESDLLKFYEEYMAVTESGQELDTTRFALTIDRAQGFFVLMDILEQEQHTPLAVKGQITGPITFATGVKDQNKRSIFYDAQLRDAAIKLLALKARWQVERLSKYSVPVIIFFDEPALAGFGSSEFISISKDDVLQSFSEVIEQVHGQHALAGVHVCANADWSLILDSEADILSFDAYYYFDKLLLFSQDLQKFLNKGCIIAWGIVPTSDPQDIAKETTDSLYDQFQKKIDQLCSMGFTKSQILHQSLITPSCGTGSLTSEQAEKVLRLTKELSTRIRQEWM
jgi:methionine synthase II (cobalamin-independent)